MPTGIYKRTPEHNLAISLGTRGRVRTPEHCKNLSESLKGKHPSEETLKKLRESHLGQRRPCTESAKIKLSIANKGKKRTEEMNLHNSLIHRGKNTGAEHWNWKDGKTPANMIARHRIETKLWKKSCLERDDFTCAKTGQRGGKLVVHHINNFAGFPELRTALSNGITLSNTSHIAFHKIYGYNNNTKEQLEEFLGYKLV
jgi:hypothetical protein